MRGFTLIELMVVLLLFGLIIGVSSMAFVRFSTSPTTPVADLQRARAEAIRSGAPRSVHGALFLPDGRAVGPSVDPLTGAPHAR